MNNLTFSPVAWDEYLYWQQQDKKTMKRINQLLKDISRDPFEGIGKPEPLRYCEGCWSRRIDDKNRLVYSIRGDEDIMVISCRGHYED
jgi:toxin YoeB